MDGGRLAFVDKPQPCECPRNCLENRSLRKGVVDLALGWSLRDRAAVRADDLLAPGHRSEGDRDAHEEASVGIDARVEFAGWRRRDAESLHKFVSRIVTRHFDADVECRFKHRDGTDEETVDCLPVVRRQLLPEVVATKARDDLLGREGGDVCRRDEHRCRSHHDRFEFLFDCFLHGRCADMADRTF